MSRPAAAKPAPTAARDDLLSARGVKQLLALHAGLIEELRFRKIVRTSNDPVADYAETLFARAFGWTLEASSARAFDATDPAGLRYQIKGRRLTTANPLRQVSAIRRLPERGFDHLAAVLFYPDFSVMRAVILPHEHIEPRARYNAHANGWCSIWTVLSGACRAPRTRRRC
jgi:hypothetical protein